MKIEYLHPDAWYCGCCAEIMGNLDQKFNCHKNPNMAICEECHDREDYCGGCYATNPPPTENNADKSCDRED